MDATDCSTATQVRVDAGRADGSGACAFFRRARFLPFFSADGGRPLFFLGFCLGVCGLDPRVGAVDEVPDTVADTGGMRDAHAETTDAVLVAEGEQVAGEPPGPRSPIASISLCAAKNTGKPICSSSCGTVTGVWATAAPGGLLGGPFLSAGTGQGFTRSSKRKKGKRTRKTRFPESDPLKTKSAWSARVCQAGPLRA